MIFSGRLKRGVILFLVILYVFLPSIMAEVKTDANVHQIPPAFIAIIPNQSILASQTLINSFNLNDYFIDPTGENLNYSYSNLTDIDILIDSSGFVSFYPDPGFIGNSSVYFYASNSLYNTSSNQVYIFVGLDNESPKWNSISKSKSDIYQNDYVNFSTIWTDNFQLKSYSFIINQGYSAEYIVNFSGKLNISKYMVQISASPGSIVSWMFCANDTSNNRNCTFMQTFNVTARAIPSGNNPGQGAGGAASGGGASSSGGAGSASTSQNSQSALSSLKPLETNKNSGDFLLDSRSFRISLKQGSRGTKILKITNTGSLNSSFNLWIENIEKFVTLSDSSFSLQPGETKLITIDFFVPPETVPDEYFGKLVINSSSYSSIPIIIDVNPIDTKYSINVNISEKYKNINPGEIVKANISLKNLKDLSYNNVTLFISIKDFNGNIYESFQENFKFGGSSLIIERNLTMPKESNAGEYIFYARISDDNSVAIDSDNFLVGSKFELLSSAKPFTLFGFIFLLSFFALILALKYRNVKEKEKVLNLYLVLNELKKLVKEGNFDKAAEVYIRIKRLYGEPVSKSSIKDKEVLKEEIKKLSEKLKNEIDDKKEDSTVKNPAVNPIESNNSNKDQTKNENKNTSPIKEEKSGDEKK